MIREQDTVAMNKHFEVEIKTLQNAPRDADKLQALIIQIESSF
jgi:hypothetical protein